MVARVKPFSGRGGGAAGAVKAHARAHLNERSALRKLGRLVVFHAHQGNALIVFQDAHGAHGNSIAGVSLPDRTPVSGGENHQADHQHRRQHHGGKHGGKNDKGFFQR